MMFDLSKIFALPNTFLKSKNYCTTNEKFTGLTKNVVGLG